MENSSKEKLSRIQKLDALIKEGVNPYPSASRKDQDILSTKALEGKSVKTAGKISSIRSHGKSIFMDLKDSSGEIQLYFKLGEVSDESFSHLKMIDTGDSLSVEGEVFTTHAGEISIRVKGYELLSKSLLPIPGEWYGLKDVETRYRKRYLDMLINDDVKKNLITRSKIISSLRKFMGKNDFIEVETPILQPIPGGATAKPFTTHYNILKQDMYLRIAPELYLKRMVVGGFEKVFEIGKNFRNEGVSHMHNPEFTMMEFYWAYQDYKGLMEFTQELITDVINETVGDTKIEYQGDTIDFKPPYKVITFHDLVLGDCGIDIAKFKTFDELKAEIIEKQIKIDMSEISAWSKLVDELYKKVSRPKIIEPVFIIDHPIELTPLAKAHDDNKDLAQRFQLVCAKGIELINAYTELNDPIEQEKRLIEQAKLNKGGWEESSMMDADYIEALKYGLPPTAGWGMGIERLTMVLTDQYSIKEVIPFPTLKIKSDEN